MSFGFGIAQKTRSTVEQSPFMSMAVKTGFPRMLSTCSLGEPLSSETIFYAGKENTREKVGERASEEKTLSTDSQPLFLDFGHIV